MKTQEKNFDGIKLSGFTAILIMLALTGTAIYLLSLPQTPSIIAGVICGICVVVMLPGFMIIQPNNSRVLTFFGRYAGTVISNGFYWVNPLFLKSTVTLRILNLNIDPIKVNDKVGNPIMIGFPTLSLTLIGSMFKFRMRNVTVDFRKSGFTQ